MNDTETETWRAVAGYENIYEVSDHGRVRSIDRVTSNGTPRRGKILKLCLTGHETGKYYNVKLSRSSNVTTRLVHQLVAEAFIGPRPDGYETCHYDGDSLNNHISNLRYDTRSGNEQDRIRHGRHNHADKTHCANGHEYTSENLHIRNTDGARICRICERARTTRYRERLRLEKTATS